MKKVFRDIIGLLRIAYADWRSTRTICKMISMTDRLSTRDVKQMRDFLDSWIKNQKARE